MNNLKFVLVLLVGLIGLVPLSETKAQQISVNFSTFHSELSPHGRWITNPRYGQVWIYNNPSFRPYATDGHWEFTNYGWSWVSDFDWGWAPFHYGRWERDSFEGWMWIPGYQWASAWVSWSQYGDYYGWAPLGYGNSINDPFNSFAYDRWTFIPRQYINDRNFNRHCIIPNQADRFRNAIVINNYYNTNDFRFQRGPDRAEVERYSRRRIRERQIDPRTYGTNYNNSQSTTYRNEKIVRPTRAVTPGSATKPIPVKQAPIRGTGTELVSEETADPKAGPTTAAPAMVTDDERFVQRNRRRIVDKDATTFPVTTPVRTVPQTRMEDARPPAPTYQPPARQERPQPAYAVPEHRIQNPASERTYQPPVSRERVQQPMTQRSQSTTTERRSETVRPAATPQYQQRVNENNNERVVRGGVGIKRQ